MRRRSMVLAGAAVLGLTHVVGVLLGAPVRRFAEVGTFLLLSVYAAGAVRVRWLGPVVLAPLVLHALRTIPPATAPTYGWQVLTREYGARHLVVHALDQGFRTGGAALLTVLALAVLAARGDRRAPTLSRVTAGLRCSAV